MRITRLSIRKWRLKNGLTQWQAADKIGVSINAIRSWEQGRRHPQGLYLSALERAMSK